MIRVSSGVGQYLIDDLLRRLAKNGAAGHRVVRLSDGGEKDAQIIVNLRRSGDDGARVCAGAALFNGNGWREAFYKIDVRFLHLVEKLPGISGKTFDVTSLAFGVEGIEGERGFAGAAQARDNDQLFPRNLDVEILQIMLACSADLDTLCRHRTEFVEPISQAQPSNFSSEFDR